MTGETREKVERIRDWLNKEREQILFIFDDCSEQDERPLEVLTEVLHDAENEMVELLENT